MSSRAHTPIGPALAMLLFGEIPLGLRSLDALVKEAPVDVFGAGTVQCGSYLILFGGQVEPVQRALRRAVEVAPACVLDQVLLAHADERILPAVRDGVRRPPSGGDTLAVIETRTPPTLLRAVDAALKGAQVDLIELRVADGLGGKALACLWGEIHDAEAAVNLANESIARGVSEGASSTVIPRSETELVRMLNEGTRFFKGWRG